MLDISWVELAFCAAFALVVIGPKDLPVVFKTVGGFVKKARKIINDIKGSVTQLEREINISDGKTESNYSVEDLLPESVRSLPKDFIPGSLPKAHHQQRREQSQQATDSLASTPDKHPNNDTDK